jgi:membrane protein required for beta-lactamase induction
MVFEAHTRIFAPLFWFAVLGPAGVVLFSIAASLRTTVQPNERVGQVLMRLFEILAWLPARLLLLGCGLAGTLAPTVHAWRELDDFSLAATWRALGDGSLSALGYGNLQDITTDDPHVYWINSMYGLIQRAFTVWLVLFAFLTLGVLAA